MLTLILLSEVSVKCWNWTRRYDGSLVHQASGLCLDVHGWDTTNGSALDLWDCNGAANERWYAEAQTK